MPLNSQVSLQVFDKLDIDFIGPIHHQERRWVGGISLLRLSTRWAEVEPVKDYTAATAVNFLFEYVLTRFGFPKILMSDRGTHLLNETISAMLEEFQVYHQKSIPYHPQVNGIVEAFNKILENSLTKFCKA